MSDAAKAERLEQIVDQISRLAAGDLEARLPISSARDQLDTISVGLNMLAEELGAARAAEEELQQTLEEKVRQRTEELEHKARTIADQSRTILELSTPILQVWDATLVVPLIGTVDSSRARQLTDGLLQRVAASGARHVLLDVTGLPLVDTAVAQHLMQLVRAVRLLGARVVLTGVRPPMAQVLVKLGVDLSGIETRGSLHDGLQRVLSQTGRSDVQSPAAQS